MRFRTALFLVCAVPAALLQAQTPITRTDAIQTAMDRGGRLAVARADTAVASAAVIAALARPNPSVSLSYSKAPPNHHVNFDIPFEFPMMRTLRVEAARAGLKAANVRFQFNRAMIAMEADTTYTRAVAARERLVLSRRNALDADSLLHMVERRRDAGDASDMDVALARVNAGQQGNVAASDSLTLISAVLDLQAVLGMLGERLELNPTDSLGTPPAADAAAPTSLDVMASQLSLQSAQLNSQFQRRSVWSQFSLALGFEHGDPDLKGLLPTFGVGIGIPLFDRNRGGIAQAEAERAKAQAELTLAQIDARNALSHALRERENAMGKVARDRALVADANVVARMTLTAYREGASTLANVLEAQRTVREVLSQYIDDLAAAWIATAELRVFSLTPTAP
jgi:cobalt-zinc-cadmium efflux system outer membrane protein